MTIAKLLEPESVAVVGASNDVTKLRGKLMHLVGKAGFAGAIYPINPGYPEIQGHTAYPDLASLPAPVDLVLIAVPGAHVPAVLDQAVAAGAAGAVVFSADVPDLSRFAGKLRLMGPNTEGYFNPSGKIAATFAQVVDHALDATETPPPARRPIAIVSQSGGLGFALYGRALAEHLDVRSVITTGNEGDLECLDFVEHLVEAGEVGVILMFIEGLKTPSRLSGVAARAAERGVSIVVLKVGQSEAGQRAALSHTAHLAGADSSYDAWFLRTGIVRVQDQEQMIAVAAALSRLPPAPGKRTAVVTTSGGAGAWAADLCSAAGLELPALSEALEREVAALIPKHGAAGNPIDVTAAAVEDGGATLVKVVRAVLASDEIDGVIVNMGLAAKARIAKLAPVLGPLFEGATKPVLFHSHIAPTQENLRALALIGAHGFQTLRGAALGLAASARAGASMGKPAMPAPVGRQPVVTGCDGVLDETRTRALLEAYDIPAPRTALVTGEQDAISAAEGIGCPVAMKIQSVDLPHKTEAGGVALKVALDDVGETYKRIVANAKAYDPDARIEGVLVQSMAAPGREVVIGILKDPDFGPLVMLGAGGIHVEVLKDVVFAPPPIDRAEALRMIGSLKTAAILHGVRGAPPADLDALADLIGRVADLAATETMLDQLDLNPVFVYPAGQGVLAVDALAVAGAPAAPRGH